MYLSAVTRTLSDGEVKDADEANDPIHFFLMSGDAETATDHKTEGQFVYDTATPAWTSSIGVKAQHNCIYGFSPATAASATISTSSTYNQGAVLTLKNISPVTGSDICVIVGIKHGYDAASVAGVPDRGVFYFEKGVQNHVSVLLDHLFTRIDFSVKIDAVYHKMRSIKVKKIELLSNKTLEEVKVPLTANTTDANPIGSITYTMGEVAAGAEQPAGTLYDYTEDINHLEGFELSHEDSWIVSGFFAPGGEAEEAMGRNLLLRFTYDVYAYDVFNNNKCTRVREDCVVVNRLPSISSLAGTQLERGQSTTIALTVKPTYLYQLSENELDNPTINIDN